ncbi:MAG: putative neutral zinc metallopeptidase [Chloroflexi bacterium ADurb.Bin325]|nr:MAG: putative neutral zinc metallopeptidase [Chloroflexi bacterium ADurb.Bin325]
MYFDPTYLIFLAPALLLAFYAQFKVKRAYATYTRVANERGITGLQAARMILPGEGLGDVGVEGTPGELTDHYDPRTKTLRLSAGVAQQPSVAALAIVAHEIGHALQDSQGYAPLKLRGAIVPAVQVSAWIAPLLFLVGFLLNIMSLAWLGVLFFAASAVFALVTLPVELNASRRALHLLQAYQLTDGRELQGAKAVLDAAALTYVAALAQTLATLLYYVTLLGRRND